MTFWSRIAVVLMLGAALLGTRARAQAIPEASPVDTTTHGAPSEPVPAEPSYAPAVAYWQEGEERSLEVIRGQRTYNAGTLTASDSSATTYRLVVEAATDSSYGVRWIPRGSSSTQTDVTAKLTQLAVETGLEQIGQEGLLVQTNELGELREVLYVEPLVEVTARAIEELLAESLDDAARERGAELLATLTSPAYLTQKLTEPITVYYGLHGYEYPVGRANAYEGALPNLFGGEPIPAEGAVEVIAVDSLAGTFTLVNTLRADPERMKALVAQILRQAGTEDEAALEAEIAAAAFEMIDESRYVVDYTSGWVLRVDTLRRVSLDDVLREQFVRITLGEP